MPKRIRSNLRLVLPLIKTRLIARNVGTEANINLCPDVSMDGLPPVIGLQDFLLAVGGTTPVGQFDDGSARFDKRASTTLNVLVRTSVVLDQVNDWTAYLTQATTGHLAMIDQIIDALEDWDVEDAGGDVLTYESLAWLGSLSSPRSLRNKSPGWGGTIVPFTLPIRLNLTNAEQTDQSWR